MNPGQERFLEFMMQRAKEGDSEGVKERLLKSFEEQKSAPLSRGGFEELKRQLLELIDDNHVHEVSNAMDHFGKQLH